MKEELKDAYKPVPMDLAPAKWIWFPSQRTLPNTFVLFRKEVELTGLPAKASGWIAAESRYRLTVNGERVQWGPGPSDPRWPDADPFDITGLLKPGVNVIGVEVLYYGLGEGTWVMGKPGLILKLDLEFGDGSFKQLVSDESWFTCVDRAHRPGQFKRWYLRSLQEEFDARLHPKGWNTANFKMDERWAPAMVIDCPPDKPVLCGDYPDYLQGIDGEGTGFFLRRRQIPLLKEAEVPVKSLVKQGKVTWLKDPDDWFQFRTPNSFRIREEDAAEAAHDGSWVVKALDGQEDGVFLTFDLEEQVVGWPYFSIEASEGTVVELICHEAYDPGNALWLDSQWFSWSRFICREGRNFFECFDFESLRWIQLHIRRASGPVKIARVGVRRRLYPWSKESFVRCSEPELQRLFDACFNTINNNAQDTVVDGMARERQQYSGDIGHELHAIRYAFGETLLPARFLRTFSEGLTLEGYFLDCWPAYDRMARIAQRQLGITRWGPILDHGIQFVFDCWNHYMETGRLEDIREPYPRLLRFASYLEGLRQDNGLLPVENLGVPSVWIDHDAYVKQRHKQCAFNLYAAAMYRHALAPLARAFGDGEAAKGFEELGDRILECAVRHFWCSERGIFVCNLPWLREEGEIRLCDRSLAASILFDQCPEGRVEPALEALAGCPAEMGMSYPPNAGWRYQALAKLGRVDVILEEFRKRWAVMESVVKNNTLQETWEVKPDARYQWSHASVAPLYVLFMDIAGIRPAAPGFKKCRIRPQLGDLKDLDLKAHVPMGTIRFTARRVRSGHELLIEVPEGCDAELLLPGHAKVGFKELPCRHGPGLKRFKLTENERQEFFLPGG